MFMTKKLLSILFLLATQLVLGQQLTATATLIKDLSCVDTAIITVIASGGTPDYVYSIDDGATFVASNTFSISSAGIYVILVRDKNYNITTSNAVSVLPVVPPTITTIHTPVSCSGANNGTLVVNTFGNAVPYIYTLFGPVIIGPQMNNVFTYLPVGTYFVQVTDAKQCISRSTVTITQPAPLTATYTITQEDAYTITTITASGGVPPYQYSQNGGAFTPLNRFANLPSGMYVFNVEDSNGCIVAYPVTIPPTAPIINNPTQTFPQGATLADIMVNGQNIKWYATSSGNRAMTSELPLSTVLVDGTTYYATQTVNGIESQRTAITVKVGTLSNTESSFQQLKIFPIPAQEHLQITNATIIESVEIYTYLGTAVGHYEVASQNISLDISNLASGVYFAKLKTNETEKTVKFIKE